VMEQAEPALAALHQLDEQGKVSRRNRDRFGSFLIGWLGGPDDYVRDHGHPRLRMRHAAFPIGQRVRDRWLELMLAAIDRAMLPDAVQPPLRAFFASTATFLMNQPGK